MRYNSRWDGSTWSILLLVFVIFLLPALLDADVVYRIIIILADILFTTILVVLLKGIYYKIDGNNLVVYQFFVPKAFPIDKIDSVLPTKSILSSPATSLSKRIAIRFSDKNILRSSIPLIISPALQSEFISHLVLINPNIKH